MQHFAAMGRAIIWIGREDDLKGAADLLTEYGGLELLFISHVIF